MRIWMGLHPGEFPAGRRSVGTQSANMKALSSEIQKACCIKKRPPNTRAGGFERECPRYGAQVIAGGNPARN